MSNTKKEVTIYTDGACSGNPGPGGWGAILFLDGIKKSICGAQNNTTNNQMELTAVVEALKSLAIPHNINIYTDSVYVKNGINDWINKWRINGWKSINNKPIKNMELWHQIDNFMKIHKITCHWVKAHQGNQYNEEADCLARSKINNFFNTDI